MKINVSTFKRVTTILEKSCPGLFATGHVLCCTFSKSALNHSFSSCVVQCPTLPLPAIGLQSC